MKLKINNKIFTYRLKATWELTSEGSVLLEENSNFVHEESANKKIDKPLQATVFLKNKPQLDTQNEQATREEIKLLKSELIQKNEELQQLRNTENKGLIAANEFKEMQQRLMCRIKNLEDELVSHKSSDRLYGKLII